MDTYVNMDAELYLIPVWIQRSNGSPAYVMLSGTPWSEESPASKPETLQRAALRSREHLPIVCRVPGKFVLALSQQASNVNQCRPPSLGMQLVPEME